MRRMGGIVAFGMNEVSVSIDIADDGTLYIGGPNVVDGWVEMRCIERCESDHLEIRYGDVVKTAFIKGGGILVKAGDVLRLNVGELEGVEVFGRTDPPTTDVWVAAIHDRHTDPQYRVFYDRGHAIEWALPELQSCLHDPDAIAIDEFDDGTWYAAYEYESDHACVRPAELMGDVVQFRMAETVGGREVE